jgi:2-methylcitrate dehydratase
MHTLAHRLAEYAASLTFAQLPPTVVHEVKRRVIDSLGCALGAWDAEPCTIARRVASRFGAGHGATLWGTEHLAPPDWAAFANGCLVRYLDFNDTYLSKEPAHPSDNIPALFAVAESVSASGRDLITAIALAYEIQCRLCDTVSLRAQGWDHVTYVAFSSALAAARLLELSPDRMRHAVNIAGVSAGSLRQSRAGELSHWKAATVAHAARRGVFAALLAAEGMTGPAPIFEGTMGIEKLVTHAPLEEVVLQHESFIIMQTSIKFWPAEYHAQSSIDAALRLRKQIGDPSAIESVLIESHDAAVDIIGSEPEKWRPQSRETADHSLPYLTAVALVDGEITSRQFEPDRFTDPSILGLVQRVKVERHPDLSARYPQTVGNIVTVRLHDGRTFSMRVDHALGHAMNPLSDPQLEAKFRALASTHLDPERAAAVLQIAWNLDGLDDVSALSRSLLTS